MSQYREDLAWPFQDFGNRVDKSEVIARLMSFNGRFDWGHDVCRPAVFRQKDLDTRACGFYRLDKDEFIFVGQDHAASRQQQVARSVNNRQYSPNWATHPKMIPQLPADDFLSETFSLRSHSKDGR